MKLFFLLLTICGVLVSCTWNGHKNKALEAAQQKFEADLLLEVESLLKEKPVFQKKYISTIIAKTEFSIHTEEKSGDQANIQVQIKSVPLSARQSLREIFAKQNPGRETNINPSEALTLIYQQLKLEPNSFHEQIISIKLKKKSVWEVESVQ